MFNSITANESTRRSWLTYVILRNCQQFTSLSDWSVLLSCIPRRPKLTIIKFTEELHPSLILRILNTQHLGAFNYGGLKSGVMGIFWSKTKDVRFEALAAVTMKNAVPGMLRCVALVGTGVFRGTYHLHHQGDKNERARSKVSSN
jgi:hypothetical protein